MRILFVLLVLAALYIAADRGMFDSFRSSSSETTAVQRRSEAGDGPAERLGATIDEGIAGAGRAVQSAGRKLESAARGTSAPRAEPSRSEVERSEPVRQEPGEAGQR